MPTRVLVLGIDCMSPSLVLDRWRGKLPNLSMLMEEGAYGPLRSTDPPITVPAWASMLTGRSPAELGLYGFRRRQSYEPFDSRIVTSSDLRFPWIWEVIGGSGLESLILGVPPTWPPRPMPGRLISDFLTPDTSAPFTWPPELALELQEAAGGPYILDVPAGGELGPAALIRQAGLMAERRFRLFNRLLERSQPALAVLMEIGLDRIQHGLWHYMDPAHPRYPGPGNEHEDAVLRYHLLLDSLVGRAVEAAGPQAHVLVVSDHGAQAMLGGVRVNEWLRREGWLVIESGPTGEPPEEIPWGTPLSRCRIDWRSSRAFAEGGYCGRVYLNVAGRQREGCVPPHAYEAERETLAKALAEIPGPDGRPLAGTRVMRPEEVYGEAPSGHPPDLMVYFGDLAWRALGSVGTRPPCRRDLEVAYPASILSTENDGGPDGANHAMEGVLILREAGASPRGFVDGLEIRQVFSILLALLGRDVPLPPALRGAS